MRGSHCLYYTRKLTTRVKQGEEEEEEAKAQKGKYIRGSAVFVRETKP